MATKPKRKKKPAAKQRAPDMGAQLRQAQMLLNVSRTVAAMETVDEVLASSRTVAAMETVDEVLATLVKLTIAEHRRANAAPSAIRSPGQLTIAETAERGTLFLNDPQTGELYSRFAHGEQQREIRLLNTSGLAGHVFTSGEGLIVKDAYKDDRFNKTIDQQTGFHTKSVLCAPVRTVKGEIIGVAQALNNRKGRFTKDDLALLEDMTTQAAVALQSTQFVERMQRTRAQEMEFLDVVSDVTAEIDLGVLLQKVMSEATRMLNADRSTLFLNDEKTNELFSRVAQGDSIGEIRLPNHLGIAGAVFTSGHTVNIPYAYADLRFNPAFDKKTGYFTRSILCVPVVNKNGKTIGVTQVLNRKGGPFTEEDESRLKAFTAQVAIALENAKLFDDVQNMKNYNESMLESMTNGVITTDEEGKIVTCNEAGLQILQVDPEAIMEKKAEDFFTGPNAWILERVNRVEETQESDITMDAEMEVGDEEKETISVNLTVLPLVDAEEKKLGSMFMIEDISSEKRMKSTMSRYMDPGLADQVMSAGGGEDLMGGKSTVSTILFSDVRGFTTITEELGAQGTVELLNDYFTIMVDCITEQGGMLDKFIGDAIMAAFGIPVAHDDDEDRGVRAAINMIVRLWEWNVERESRGQMPVDMGVGLNTDTVVSGNIGSPKRMDYTMIGDGVNLAARLESACKQYSARILISQNTVDKLKGTYRIRDIDDVVVKGKTQPVCVYEVLDFHNDDTFPNLMEVVNYFKEGRNHYRAGAWDKSIKSFKECLKGNPADKLSETYIDRCQQLKKTKPKNWDGVWVMTSK